MTSYYANPDDPALAHLGRTLGEDAYELRTVLGRGGGATVFGALAIQRKQFVAVKLADRGVEGPRSAVEAVVIEAQRLRSMHHPHLIPVLESGVDDGVPYYVMPLAANGSLKQLLASVGGPLPLELAARIGSQIASALQYLHSQGWVHLDVKPGNILLDLGDWPLLSDFDSGMPITHTRGAPRRGRFAGTPAYMSPQQAAGMQVDGRSDQYSLAIVVCEMLTGVRPEALQEAEEVTLPDAVALVLNRALSADPDDRYPTIEAFGTELLRAADTTRDSQGILARLRRLSAPLAVPAAGVAATFAATSGPRAADWDWWWTLAAAAAVVGARFALAKRLQRWANGVASLLQSGSRPTANDKTAVSQRERTAKAALTMMDTVFGLSVGLLLPNTLLLALEGLGYPQWTTFGVGAMLGVAWVALVARLSLRAGFSGLAAGLLLSMPALETFLEPAVSNGIGLPALMLHSGLGLEFAAALTLIHPRFRPAVERALARHTDAALLGTLTTATQTEAADRFRQFCSAIGGALDGTLVLLVAGSLLASLAHALRPDWPYAWSTLAVLVALLVVYLRLAYQLFDITSEWRSDKALAGFAESDPT